MDWSRQVVISLVLGSAAFAFNPAAQAQEAKPLPAPLGARIADFSLPSSEQGRSWSLHSDTTNAKAIVVLFLGTQCPLNNQYLPTVTELYYKYAPHEVVFVGINSNAQDSLAEVTAHAAEFKLPFVVLKDAEAKIADRFAAARTPEAFVLDGSRTVRYRGRVDDRFEIGITRPKATHNDLADAIAAVLLGNAVTRPATDAPGCPIGRPTRQVADATVTYSKHVAPLVQKNCQGCHRPGEVAPFALMTYEDAAAWSGAMREAVADRRMPPWHADPAHGHFKNARVLTDAERATLLSWIDQGCPEGDRADLPPPRKFVEGWGIGKPDEVFTVPAPIPVPAQAPKGGVPYKFVLVGEPFAEEKWVQAVECRPGAASVVHHITAFILQPGVNVSNWDQKTDLEILLVSYSDECNLAGYGPGEDPLIFPPGEAKRIRKGARIVLEIHYTPNGLACSDRSCVGLVYAKEPPKHRVMTGGAMQMLLMIPPGIPDHKVVASRAFDKPAMLLGLCPHMHMRGKSATFELIRPDGSRELLLSVPRYDFNWQTNYYLAEPLPIPAGSKLEFTAHYDNSPGNPNNPDPTKLVFWGQQSWEEMMAGFFEYYWVDEKPGE